ESLKLQRNPDVTVRSRGVMEKCTYCIQRISEARIDARKENRPIRDGEIVTACQAACPTETIVFDDLNNKGSAVSRKAVQKENYQLLRELDTRPRTSYLARITNPKEGDAV
ncbi:MAG: hydrogenase, partial [Candidatus Omnitrophica bacterium]|nr:hydrogenase [Candidatus Omnitrophota bacterium]